MPSPAPANLGPHALRATESYTFAAQSNGTSYVVSVALPPSYGADPDRRYRVLCCLDADIIFPTVVDAARLMVRDITAASVEELIVVGIGWADVDGKPMFPFLRMTDFSPPEERMPPWVAGLIPPGIECGGADRFLAFLQVELQPWLRAGWRCTEEPGTLFGYSYGGLFGLYAMITGAPMFDRYIIGSPGICFADDILFDIEAGSTAPIAARAYVSIGEQEQSGFNPDYRGLAANTAEIVKRLRGRGDPELRLTDEVLAGESHNSGIGVCFVHGLRALHTVVG